MPKSIALSASLPRVEQDIATHIETERQRILDRAKLPLYEVQGLFAEEMSEGAYQKQLMGQIVEAFHEFSLYQAEQGYDETYFVGEATKGVRLLDIMLRRYSIVATNPPYMSHRNMSSVMSDYLIPIRNLNDNPQMGKKGHRSNALRIILKSV